MANDRLIFRCVCGATTGVAKYYPGCPLDIAAFHWIAALEWMNEHLPHWPGLGDINLGDTVGVEFGTEALLAEDYPHHWTLTRNAFPEVHEWCWVYFGNAEPGIAQWNGHDWWSEEGRYDTSKIVAWLSIGPTPSLPRMDALEPAEPRKALDGMYL